MSENKPAESKASAPAAESVRPIPENLPEELLPLYDWWHGEGKKTVLLAAAAIVVIGLGLLYRHHLTARARLASEQLLAANSTEELESLTAAGGSKIGTLAQFRLAKGYYDAGRYDDALALYETLAQRPSHPFAAIATLGKAHVLEAQEKYDAAREIFAAFRTRNPDHYLLPQAVIGEARCLAALGDKASAAALLDTMIAAKTDTPWEQIAENSKDIIDRYEKRAKRSLFEQADLFANELAPSGNQPPALPEAEKPPATAGDMTAPAD